MEKRKGRRRNVTARLCIPVLRSTTAASRSPAAADHQRFSPMSLLERIREAVFRLIMLSALSGKAASPRQPAEGSVHHAPPLRIRSPRDPHHSDAVAECIEFIKKSATPEPTSRRSTSGSPVQNSGDEAIAPSPGDYCERLSD